MSLSEQTVQRRYLKCHDWAETTVRHCLQCKLPAKRSLARRLVGTSRRCSILLLSGTKIGWCYQSGLVTPLR